MTIEELIVELGFDIKDKHKVKEFESAINGIAEKAQKLDNQDFSKFQNRLVKLAEVAGKTTRALAKIGTVTAKSIGKAISLSASLAKNLATVASGAIAGSGVIASETAEKSRTAKGYGTNYTFIKAIQRDMRDITVDNINDLFEEMRNKIGLTSTSLAKAERLQGFKKSQYNIRGYTDTKGKHKDAKRLEEGTLDDLISTGVFAKVDKQFANMTNKINIFRKFQKMTAEQQFLLMGKIVDYNKEFTSSIDDWLSGESQRLFSQLRVRAKELGITIEQMIKRNQKDFFINEKDVSNLEKYSFALHRTGSIIAQIGQKASAGLGDAITPYISRLNAYVQNHKEQIVKAIDEASQYLKSKFQEIENYLTSNKFVDSSGDFMGLKNAVNVVLGDISTAFSTHFGQIVEDIRTKITEAIGVITLLATAFAVGGPIGVAVLGLATMIALNFDKVKQKILEVITSAKEALGLSSKVSNPVATSGKSKAQIQTKIRELEDKKGGLFGSSTNDKYYDSQINKLKKDLARLNTKGISDNSNTTANVTVNVTGSNASPQEIATKTKEATISALHLKKTMVANTAPAINK